MKVGDLVKDKYDGEIGIVCKIISDGEAWPLYIVEFFDGLHGDYWYDGLVVINEKK